MIDKLQNYDTVITTNNIKKIILKTLSQEKKLLNLKFYTLEEFKNNYYGIPTKEALYFLMKHYNYSYDIALEYLSNIFYDTPELKELKNVLDSNNLITYNHYFKKSLKRVVTIGISLDDALVKELEFYHLVNLSFNTENFFSHQVVSYETSSEEVVSTAVKIRNLLKKKVSLNDIYLVNVDNTYFNELDRTFKNFNIPLNLYETRNIGNTKTIQEFLRILKETLNVNEALECILDDDIKGKIVNLFNSYTFDYQIDNTFLEMVTCDIKKINISLPKYDKAVNLINISDMLLPDKYYFVLNFNQGIVPRIYHDDKLIKDKMRKSLGLATSLDLLKREKQEVKIRLLSNPNVYISYKEKDNYSTYYPSPLISDLGLDVVIEEVNPYNYSHLYNKINLGTFLDRYLKYNEKNDYLKDLMTSYPDINYNTYDNRYIKVEFDDLYKYLNGKSNLSYSAMNNYYLCAFRFYIANILKLDPFVDTFAAFLGSLFHDCLSKMYNEGFDLRTEYDKYLEKRELTNKEKFYVDNLYTTLEFIIKTIREQESKSMYDKTLTETRLNLRKEGKITINFLGFVDKIKYLEDNDGKYLVAIIDYKTGYVPTTLDNINYGLHLQLPVYIYLTKRGLHKDIKITGFYLQKILNGKTVDSDSFEEDSKKALKLDGYSIDSEEELIKFDRTYTKSDVIKGMATTSKGFAHYAKLFSDSDIEKIDRIVDERINEVVEAIWKGDFPINPKRVKGELIGCEFCKYKEICYRREEDIVDLEYKTREDILGDDLNAKVDE